MSSWHKSALLSAACALARRGNKHSLLPSHTRQMWRRRCTPPDAQRPAQPRCFFFDWQSLVLSFFSDASEETRVELQRRVELDGGILMDGASPLNKKEPIRRSSSAHITVHMAQYCFSSSLHPLSLLRTFESELSWLPATKQSKTWGTCQKIKVWRLPCLATPGPPPLCCSLSRAARSHPCEATAV